MNGQTILVAEHEVEIRNYVELALRCEGYRVRAVDDRTEVLNFLERAGTEVSLVILDLLMPGQDGLALLREIRRLVACVPVIVFSTGSPVAKVAEAIESGATDFLSKPVTHDQLIRAVRKAMPRTVQQPLDALPPPCRRQSDGFVTANPAMQAIRAAIKQIAASDVPVVIRGESGAGKEVIAREIHAQSPRAGSPFLKINCAALAPEPLEGVLFGYENSASSGAMKFTPGKFELADGGVILLDEIGDMDFKLQAELLQVLQDNEFHRLGGHDIVRVNVRVIAATHCDLEKAIEKERFREDLYYRLNVISIDLPPLRDRKDEVLPLAQHFLAKHGGTGARAPLLTGELKDALLAYNWPGNVRELENVIRKLLVFGDEHSIAQELRVRAMRGATLPGCQRAGDSAKTAGIAASALDQVNEMRKRDEAQAIIQALNHTHWNRKRAAAVLNIDYKGLLYRMKKLGIGGYQDGDVRRRPNGAHPPTGGGEAAQQNSFRFR